MSNLKSRIEHIEKRVAIDEKGFTLIELLHAIKLEDPEEEARRKAMDPTCHDQRTWQEVVNSPTPKRVIRRLRREQLERLNKVQASSSDRTRETSPEEQHESPQSPGRAK